MMSQHTFKGSLLKTCLAGMIMVGGSMAMAHPGPQASTMDSGATQITATEARMAGVSAGTSSSTEKSPLAYPETWAVAFQAWESEYLRAMEFNIEGRKQYEQLIADAARDLVQLGLAPEQFTEGAWRAQRLDALDKQNTRTSMQEAELERLALYNGLAQGITLWIADRDRLAEERTLIERLRTEPAMLAALQAFKAQHSELGEAEALQRYLGQHHSDEA
jgi:hypothetical protein